MDQEENKKVALKVFIDGKERDVTFDELTLSNNLALESLLRVLARKKVVDSKELMEEMERVRKERMPDLPPDKK
ncbi:MAG: hypothetical protein MUO85_06825 [candidate division Zixibacteria bacterium]|nr:hypothetical protein [candidate division Zixibacteria bacterium]